MQEGISWVLEWAAAAWECWCADAARLGWAAKMYREAAARDAYMLALCRLWAGGGT